MHNVSDDLSLVRAVASALATAVQTGEKFRSALDSANRTPGCRLHIRYPAPVPLAQIKTKWGRVLYWYWDWAKGQARRQDDDHGLLPLVSDLKEGASLAEIEWAARQLDRIAAWYAARTAGIERAVAHNRAAQARSRQRLESRMAMEALAK